MIKAIVYDFDGMVFTEPHFYTEELEIRYGIPLKESLFSDDPRYSDCKKGKITLNQFLKTYFEKWRRYPKYQLRFEEAKKEWFEFAKINEEVLKIAKKLKEQGIINLILTNNTRERIEYLDKKHQLAKIFAIIGSYDLGVLKPHPAFAKILKEKFKLTPEEVLWFDDQEKNVKGLKKLGFKAVIYKRAGDFKSELKKVKLWTN